MNGDISRVTFNKINNYTRVVMQQGRVQLDADFNEQTAILLHYLQALAEDIIGPYGGPTGKAGFELTAPTTATTLNDLTINKGRYYVNGRLCELDENTSFPSQSYAPATPAAGTYLAYLDVWERPVTALEDPHIREVALGGADTAARTKLVWQVKLLLHTTATSTCKPFSWDAQLDKIDIQPRGLLNAKAKAETPTTAPEPCLTSPDARFRGLENQLYRVEIHKPGPAGTATFKWSRDNATVVAAFKRHAGNELVAIGMRDASRWFTAGDWAELTHDQRELRGEPGTMVRIDKVEGESLWIDPGTVDPVGGVFDPTAASVVNAKIRRWDQRETGQEDDPLLHGGTIPVKEGTGDKDWFDLESGIRIRFAPGAAAAPHQYRTGDYWLIPARVATGDIEWPSDPAGQAPSGVEHHYAPLAFVTLGAGGAPSAVIDLRHKFSLDNTCVKP